MQDEKKTLTAESVEENDAKQMTLLGKINEQEQYVLPANILNQIYVAKKYIEKKVQDTVYLSCHIESVEHELTILMNYVPIEKGEKVKVTYSLLEEINIAGSMMTNQIVSPIWGKEYDYSDDVLLEAFADFNVYIKDGDNGEERKLHKGEKFGQTNSIVEYNIALEKKKQKKVKQAYNRACEEQLAYLKGHNSAYAQAILSEVEKGVEKYIALQPFDIDALYDIQDKGMYDILTNAIEIVDAMGIEDQLADQQAFHEVRAGILSILQKESKEIAEEEITSKLDPTSEITPEMEERMKLVLGESGEEKEGQKDLTDYLSHKTRKLIKEHEKVSAKREKEKESIEQKYEKLNQLMGKSVSNQNSVDQKTEKLDSFVTSLVGRNKGKATVTKLEEQRRTVTLDQGGHLESQIDPKDRKKLDKSPAKDTPQKKKEKEKPKKKKASTKPAAAPKKKEEKKAEKEEEEEAKLTGGDLQKYYQTKQVSSTTEQVKDSPAPKQTEQVDQTTENKEKQSDSSLSSILAVLQSGKLINKEKGSIDENTNTSTLDQVAHEFQKKKAVEKQIPQELDIDDVEPEM